MSVKLAKTMERSSEVRFCTAESPIVGLDDDFRAVVDVLLDVSSCGTSKNFQIRFHGARKTHYIHIYKNEKYERYKMPCPYHHHFVLVGLELLVVHLHSRKANALNCRVKFKRSCLKHKISYDIFGL